MAANNSLVMLEHRVSGQVSIFLANVKGICSSSNVAPSTAVEVSTYTSMDVFGLNYLKTVALLIFFFMLSNGSSR